MWLQSEFIGFPSGRPALSALFRVMLQLFRLCGHTRALQATRRVPIQSREHSTAFHSLGRALTTCLLAASFCSCPVLCLSRFVLCPAPFLGPRKKQNTSLGHTGKTMTPQALGNFSMPALLALLSPSSFPSSSSFFFISYFSCFLNNFLFFMQ